MSDRRDPLHDALLDLEAGAPVESPPPVRRGPDRRPLWVVAGGLAAAAVLVGIAIGTSVLDRQRTGEVSPTASGIAPPASTTAPAPSTSAAPSLSPALEPTAIPASDVPIATASPDAEAAELEIVMRQGTDDTLQYVVGFGHGTEGRVAAVNVKEGAEVPATAPWLGSGAIYLETDDGSWERVETGNTFQDVGFSNLLNPLGGPMVLYGFLADAQPPRETTGVWTSTDGRTWTEVEGVWGVGSGFAEGALGYVQAWVERTELDASVIELYWSDDAVSWELVHSVPAGPYAHVYAAGAGPEGFVVAARLDADDGPLMLASGDGRTWFQAPEQTALTDDDVVMTVAPLGTDWVAAGWRSVSDLARGIDLWSSADGLHWEPAGSIAPPDDVEPFGTRVMYPSHLISRGDTLFLSGARAVEGSETRPLGVWTSTDGHTWEEMDLGGPAEVRAVDGVECCFWLGGRLGRDDGEAVIWRWDPSAR